MDVKKILEIEKDIKDLNIQGATNVAIATLEGMKTFIQE
jgi:translation initiation factor 2B subunit (eIF-2B alpha/beta/delta family)